MLFYYVCCGCFVFVELHFCFIVVLCMFCLREITEFSESDNRKLLKILTDVRPVFTHSYAKSHRICNLTLASLKTEYIAHKICSMATGLLYSRTATTTSLKT